MECQNSGNIDKKFYQSSELFSNISFKQIIKKKVLRNNLIKYNYNLLTESFFFKIVQLLTLVHAVSNCDIICQGRPGIGKTLIYVVAFIEQINESFNTVQALSIAPTRELAIQIFWIFKKLSQNEESLKIFCLIGGTPFDNQARKIRKITPKLIVSTLGRLYQQVRTKKVLLNFVNFLAIDECDHIIESQKLFKILIKIFEETHSNKQVILMSTTMSIQTKLVCKNLTKMAFEVYINDSKTSTVPNSINYSISTNNNNDLYLLFLMLRNLNYNKVIIFTSSISRARALNEILNNNNIKSYCIHSRLKQSFRLRILKKFSKIDKMILIGTDLLSRGLDFEQVDIVINFDLSGSTNQGKSYFSNLTNRIGRVGRLNKKGISISLIKSSTDTYLKNDVLKSFKIIDFL